ncbi:MAG: hypothetical protein KDE04_01785 [Anaerolineales bacterium]|nr:hypothetical protein [Anaerolineales bacterium]
MSEKARAIVQQLPAGPQINLFATRLRQWLMADLKAAEDAPDFTESRAKALFRAMDVLDDPTRHSFERLLDNEANLRLLLHDLLVQSELAENDEVVALAATSGASESEAKPAEWLSLLTAAMAWKREYPVGQLDPASPPGEHSPAGQVVRNAAQLIRAQVVRSATERDKLLRRLSQPVATPVNPDDAPSLDEMAESAPGVADPQFYRPPIPVRYPEYTDELDDVEPVENLPTLPTRGAEIRITEDDLVEAPPSWQQQPALRVDPPAPERMPEIRITRDQVPAPPPPSPLPRSGVILPQSAQGMSPQARPNMLAGLLERFGANQEMTSTRLRVIVQTHPDGPGMQALQVSVSCRGIRSTVAGTTNRNGHFLCELPVPVGKGLTYDVEVTWPRETGGETEEKSITIHNERTEFELPFYLNSYKS